jgi:hypothetical protein
VAGLVEEPGHDNQCFARKKLSSLTNIGDALALRQADADAP